MRLSRKSGKHLSSLVATSVVSWRAVASFAPSTVPAACRQGKDLIVPRGAALPANCVKCGAAAERPWRKKFHWHSPYIYLIILFNLLIYVIVALIVRKSIELNVPLCETHHGDRKRYNILAAVLMLGALPTGLLIGMTIPGSEGIAILMGTIMFVAGLVFWVIASGYIRPKKIDETQAVFRGAGEAFLQLLPPKPPF
jgi:hypothetical protein